MMKRILSIGCGLIFLAASSASASGVNLSWNDCGVVGLQNQNFVCNTNSGVPFRMYASFDPPDGITRLIGGLAVIDFDRESASVPSWWQLNNPGACRENSLTLDFGFPFTCVDYWAGAATGALSYQVGFCGYSSVARLYVSFGKPEALAGPVEAGTEYYAFSIGLDRAKTVGPGACGGCPEAVCIVLSHMKLHQAPGLGDHLLSNPRDRNFVTWQGGVLGGQCPGYPLPQECTPTLRSTWGQIKSLYR